MTNFELYFTIAPFVLAGLLSGLALWVTRR